MYKLQLAETKDTISLLHAITTFHLKRFLHGQTMIYKKRT